ncbi:transcriptional regulator [Planktothrix sp. FACHB-1375]|uniref:Transcriptional regulator n=2 Tax=Aerosakkonema funiforme TaxID=1246630 RepID=A0A926VLI8_9CYAN|nr:transcriptional regulator [Aerosakkonema funiforme FACHB-1375]
MTQTTGKTTPGTRSTSEYMSLLAAFPPRPIASEEDYIATQKVIDSLIDRPELTPDEQDYLNVLGSLIRDYEDLYEPMPSISGLDLLKALMEDWNLQEKDLIPIFQTESNVSDVLSGKQELTVTDLEKLGEFLNISPAVFLSKGN